VPPSGSRKCRGKRLSGTTMSTFGSPRILAVMDLWAQTPFGVSIRSLSFHGLATHSLHSDPPIGTDVPTFTDLRLRTAYVGQRWSSISAEAKPAHLHRSSPTAMCLPWLTLVDLGPGWWRSKLGRQFALVVLVITVLTSWHVTLVYLSLMSAIVIRQSSYQNGSGI
jgi:hypothetical protein